MPEAKGKTPQYWQKKINETIRTCSKTSDKYKEGKALRNEQAKQLEEDAKQELIKRGLWFGREDSVKREKPRKDINGVQEEVPF